MLSLHRLHHLRWHANGGSAELVSQLLLAQPLLAQKLLLADGALLSLTDNARFWTAPRAAAATSAAAASAATAASAASAASRNRYWCRICDRFTSPFISSSFYLSAGSNNKIHCRCRPSVEKNGLL